MKYIIDKDGNCQGRIDDTFTFETVNLFIQINNEKSFMGELDVSGDTKYEETAPEKIATFLKQSNAATLRYTVNY